MKLQELREYLDSAKDDKWNSLSFGIDDAEQLVAIAEAALKHEQICEDASDSLQSLSASLRLLNGL